MPRRRGIGRVIAAVNAVASPVLQRLHRPDIVHQTYFSARRPSGSAKVVLTVYDMIHEKFADRFPAVDRTAEYKRLAVERADHILCISESTQRDLLAIHPSAAGRTSVTLLGFDPVVGFGDLSTAPHDRPYLLFVGQRGGYKNFTNLLFAYSASRSLTDAFDLVAVGGGAFSAAELQAIVAQRVGGRVHQVDADDTALQNWYRGAAVFVYPSLYEGFGIPPLEAMAAGAAVVAIDVSSIPEVCGDAALYASDGSPEALREAIEAVTGSPETANRLRAAGTARLDLFSWERCAASTASIYRTLV